MLRRLVAIWMTLILAVASLLVTATAQEVDPPRERPQGVLADFRLAELPTPHAEVWLVRMRLEPGGSLPEATQAGPLITYVETGQLVIETDVAVEVDAIETARQDVTATPGSAHRTLLEGGSSASIPADARMTIRNNADSPVTFLVVIMYAAEKEAGMTEQGGEPVGLTQSLLSVGTVEFPPTPGNVTIERVTFPSDQPSVSQSMGGIELGVVERGHARVAFADFQSNTSIWPGIMNEYPEQEPLMMTGAATLEAGDGYSSASSVATWIVPGEPVEVLRVIAGPPLGR